MGDYEVAIEKHVKDEKEKDFIFYFKMIEELLEDFSKNH